MDHGSLSRQSTISETSIGHLYLRRGQRVKRQFWSRCDQLRGAVVVLAGIELVAQTDRVRDLVAARVRDARCAINVNVNVGINVADRVRCRRSPAPHKRVDALGANDEASRQHVEEHRPQVLSDRNRLINVAA